ncbi:beta-lactamase/transpeptidase-like protein [Massariosphaeria phaeospora]|uniref:Beta-lactamase/transpeptidase-like protein n=1 Tax=Massariosphaeria phaeospora TaxID=100035 RepID=A0A7C8M659_9PLEO|nr:beta-lactamase/transpeptidase-like protein [Massariosphaeria phaeospora]
MREKIFEPLGISDITFYPTPEMQQRAATLSTLSATGAGPAVDAPDFDMLFGATECLGGGGAFGSAAGYFTFLQAVLRRDPKLLTPESYDELFKPQLDQQCKKAFNEYIRSSPAHTQYIGMGLPTDIERTWSLAGMLCEQGQEGGVVEGTYMWGGVPSMTWFMNPKAGLCGVAFCQILPPMLPAVLRLHDGFRNAMFERHDKVNK